ncbi:helix-turn-helix domain-containing protein [Flavobacterium yafengii]|uniref:helix-turn-helix domain-containing protein n=1 Tax=Flavobacterium yafengii TaxID=3041253 RepID=UPI0024A9CDB3|nr:helix-turn-helix domain-containing protein [Flavobacterium yafengii]MDI6046311.1 helix-turn-helix domain-containing protein [Flavobacterium yafengii]
MHNLILSPLSLESLTEAIALRTIELLKPSDNQLNGLPIPETLLSKKEVTELLGITINTLSKYTKNGTIPAYGLGSRVMYKRSEVLQSLIRIN